MSNTKSKILRPKTPLHSVLHKTAFFKINEVVNKKEPQKLNSFANEESSVFINNSHYIPWVR